MVLRIFGEADIDVTKQSLSGVLSVACIITVIMMAMMKRAVAAGTKLQINKSQFAMVARHLAHLATGSPIDSIKQALKVSVLRQSRRFVMELKGLLAEDNEDDDDELKASVLEIIEGAKLTPCFPTSLLQPLPEALNRISGAVRSMKDETKAAALGDDVENAGQNSPLALAPAVTPARKQQISPVALALQGACDVVDEELRSSTDKMKVLLASVQKGLQGQAELSAAQADLSAFVHRQREIEDGHFTSTQSLIQFGHGQQASGFGRVNRGLGALGTVSYQTLQNLKTLSTATADEQQAAQLHREQSEIGRKLLRESSVVMAESFEALLEKVTK